MEATLSRDQLRDQLRAQRDAKTGSEAKDKLNNKDWYPCIYCSGTGKRYGITDAIPMSPEYMPCGECSEGTWSEEMFRGWYVNAVKISDERQKRELRQEELVLSLKTWWKEQGYSNADWNLFRNKVDLLRGHNKYYPENW